MSEYQPGTKTWHIFVYVHDFVCFTLYDVSGLPSKSKGGWGLGVIDPPLAIASPYHFLCIYI